jgi:hypothetical protein
MTSTCINSAGLIANIIGVTMAFYFGFPQPSHDEGVNLGLEENTRLQSGLTVKEHDEQVRLRKRRYLFWSRVGLVLMIVGFALQLVATWIA